MSEVLDQFADFMLAQRLSRGTVKLRLSHLGRLERSLPVPLIEATHGDLVTYLSGLNVAAETHRAAGSSIRKFYLWALDEELISVNPARRIPIAKSPRAIPKPIPESMLRDSLSRADMETRLMLMFGAYAGLRLAEISQVHRRDITDSGLRVVGKGGRTRLIPVHPALADELEVYSMDEGWLFPSPVRLGRPVQPDYVANRLEQVLPPGYSAHKLRHRFATLTYANTRDLFAVQTLLGHSNPETTSRYVLVPEDSLKAAVFSMK